ncbi:hypothetical protein F5Y19DRAFT_325276 [Xylariaceae sp. FL1651]|nr:hypothetical protein F5Y19DRAFT_325276 [Xylariaceae sp. FL1651]
MSQYSLRVVRFDNKHVVLTEHPDRIHPRDLSTYLLDKYGESHVEISLRKNIYVIYIDRKAAENDPDILLTTEVTSSPGEPVEQSLPEWEQKLQDIKHAEKVLKESSTART